MPHRTLVFIREKGNTCGNKPLSSDILSSCYERCEGDSSIRGHPAHNQQTARDSVPPSLRVSPLLRASASQPGRCGAASTRAEPTVRGAARPGRSEVTGSVGAAAKGQATSPVRKRPPKCMDSFFNARVQPPTNTTNFYGADVHRGTSQSADKHCTSDLLIPGQHGWP